MTTPSALDEATRLATAKAEGQELLAYHYRLVSDEMLRLLRGRKPSAATKRIAEIAQAADREHDRLLFSRGTYGRAG